MKVLLPLLFLLAPSGYAQSPASRVVAVTDPASVVNLTVDQSAAARMTRRALDVWFGGTPGLRSLLKPEDVVGIRVTTGGGPGRAVKPGIVLALVDAVRKAGVPERNIIVWDRLAEDVAAAGYREAGLPGAVKLVSVIDGAGYDGGRFFMNENLGQLIWGDHEFRGEKPSQLELLAEAGREAALRAAQKKGEDTLNLPPARPQQVSPKSYFTTLVTQRCTKIINVSVLSDHPGVGLEGCLAGLALASVDNSRRFLHHPMWGNPAIAEINADPLLRDKVVLHLLDGLLGQFAGAPEFMPRYIRSQGTLYVSNDPVALDAMALDLIETWRAVGRLPSIGYVKETLQSAAGLGLGQNDVAKIKCETPAP